jgi:hypothetical protein
MKDRITLVPLLKAPLLNGIYSLTLPSPIHLPSPQAYLGERVSADLWHARFGHPSSTGMYWYRFDPSF